MKTIGRWEYLAMKELLMRQLSKFCNYRGYIQVNKSRLEKDVARIRNTIERELLGRKSALPDQREISSFISDNAYLLGGFMAGCLIGYGFA